MDRELNKLTKKLQAECYKELCCIYSGTALTLKEWGWAEKRISNLIREIGKVWHECGEKDTDVSILEMLEEETGIELRLSMDGKSWHDLDYLNGSLSLYKVGKMTRAQAIYMRHQQIKWTGTLVQACTFLGLHRRFGFGPWRIKKVMDGIREEREAFNNNHRKMLEACKKETGVDIEEMIKQPAV